MSDDLLCKMVKVGISDLRSPGYSPRHDFIMSIKIWISRAIGRSGRRPSYEFFWTTAIIAEALFDYYKFSGCEETKKALIDYYNMSKGEKGFKKPLYVDEVMNARTFNALRRLSEPGFDDGTASRFARHLLEGHPKTITGVLPYRPANRERVLVDSIGMICPFLSEYAVDFDCKPAMDLAVLQLKDFFEKGVSAQNGLPFHGYDCRSGQNLGGEGWGRGAGWLLLGMSSVVISLCKTHPDYEWLIKHYNEMIGVVFHYQNEDGSFRELLLDRNSKKDTSATAMIAYACSKTLEAGVVDPEYLGSCLKAYQYIQSKTDSWGKVQGASGEALGANRYAEKFGWYPWGQGPSIGLAAVIDRMKARERSEYNNA